ncbi:hypothetical protein OG754_39510 [Streptomyces decoyicus]|uniref:hypothetical protein n=1 Tax=Streptomyces decoyicus TaxID=249567 RepID=UPI002E2FBB48|nr:hypothetical protein [Streptomyces decoyicus]
MEENSRPPRLRAGVLGMAVQALIVGSVPAVAITITGAPLILAQSGTLTLAFTVAVTATAYVVAGVRAATKVPLARRRVGNSVTRPDTEGVSTTVCRADADMLSLWDAPVNSPALRWGA